MTQSEVMQVTDYENFICLHMIRARFSVLSCHILLIYLLSYPCIVTVGTTEPCVMGSCTMQISLHIMTST